MDFTWQYVDKWANETPDNEAIVFGDRRLTWKEVGEQVDDCAKALLELGVERGDRVAMIAMACPEFIISYMAANKVGASWLGLSPKFSATELGYVLSDCRPTVLLSLARYLDYDVAATVQSLIAPGCSVEKVLAIDEPFDGAEAFGSFIKKDRAALNSALADRIAHANPDDVALLMYTSGSTGKPKGVEHTHRSIIANVVVQNVHFAVSNKTRALMHFPINHVAADVEIGMSVIAGGATVVMMDRFDPIETLNIVSRERITMFGQIPAMFMMEMATPLFRETDFSSVECFIWSGAAAPRPMLDALHAIAAQTGARIITGYGSTEVCGFVTFSRPDDDLDLLSHTAGYAPEPFELKIADESGKDTPLGTTGEVWIRGPILMKGYLNKPEQTAAALDHDGWYHSGDLGHLDGKGNLFLNGRKSEMFKTGGENVFPREIEDVLEGHPEVMLAAVVAVPDPVFQEVGKAFVMVRPESETDPEVLRAHCKDHLANFKVPKTFEIRHALPLLANGKVDKLTLRAEVAQATS